MNTYHYTRYIGATASIGRFGTVENREIISLTPSEARSVEDDDDYEAIATGEVNLRGPELVEYLVETGDLESADDDTDEDAVEVAFASPAAEAAFAESGLTPEQLGEASSVKGYTKADVESAIAIIANTDEETEEEEEDTGEGSDPE